MPRHTPAIPFERIAEHLAAARALAHNADASVDFLFWTRVKLTRAQSQAFHGLINKALARYEQEVAR